ncbi:hypothetical protein M0R45_028270 [Rubus argutus]|uniref:Uncharacterized protein n=1 Tax=Rubus argutus TaxID=59490 RepID=A0AAW1W565_RUBAR
MPSDSALLNLTKLLVSCSVCFRPSKEVRDCREEETELRSSAGLRAGGGACMHLQVSPDDDAEAGDDSSEASEPHGDGRCRRLVLGDRRIKERKLWYDLDLERE